MSISQKVPINVRSSDCWLISASERVAQPESAAVMSWCQKLSMPGWHMTAHPQDKRDMRWISSCQMIWKCFQESLPFSFDHRFFGVQQIVDTVFIRPYKMITFITDLYRGTHKWESGRWRGAQIATSPLQRQAVKWESSWWRGAQTATSPLQRRAKNISRYTTPLRGGSRAQT